MPLTPDFLHHLHELMVEVSSDLAQPEAKYKAELLWKARQTHNAAATPIAYKDAAIHAFETRVGKTIEKYIEALSIWGIEITPAVEKDMTNEFILLTAGPNLLHFPPAIRPYEVQPVQGAYVRERASVANRLVRQGANRLRELKMKNKQPKQAPQYVTNYNAPVTNYVDSTHIQIGELSAASLQQIQAISDGHTGLQNAARDMQTADGTSVVDKAQKWANLLSSIAGMADKVHSHYPAIVAWLNGLGIQL
jgi:hypothetical protein